MGVSTRQHWDTYWESYEATDYINHTPEIIETILRHLPAKGLRILEIGAGTGGNSSTLEREGAKITAVDYSAPALGRLRKTAALTSVDYKLVQADALHLPFTTGSFDLVFHQGFLEHFTNPIDYVREQHRVLRPGGLILVDVPQRYNWYTVYKHRLIRQGRWPYGGWEREFSLAELRQLLAGSGFAVVDQYGRGYYPRIWLMMRELHKLETKLIKRRLAPATCWKAYDDLWSVFERSALGCNLLQCVGVVGKKIA